MTSRMNLLEKVLWESWRATWGWRLWPHWNCPRSCANALRFSRRITAVVSENFDSRLFEEGIEKIDQTAQKNHFIFQMHFHKFSIKLRKSFNFFPWSSNKIQRNCFIQKRKWILKFCINISSGVKTWDFKTRNLVFSNSTTCIDPSIDQWSQKKQESCS